MNIVWQARKYLLPAVGVNKKSLHHVIRYARQMKKRFPFLYISSGSHPEKFPRNVMRWWWMLNALRPSVRTSAQPSLPDVVNRPNLTGQLSGRLPNKVTPAHTLYHGRVKLNPMHCHKVLTASVWIGCTANSTPANTAKFFRSPAIVVQTRVNNTQAAAWSTTLVAWNHSERRPNVI